VEALHPTEVRVLGALLEKDITTPEYYPLTLNALVNACNQKSSREPVVNYSEEIVTEAVTSLQHRGLALRISGAGHRVEKYGHRLGEKLNLGRREQALLCVLMLRGPQTVGELRGRTERMHDFADLEEVERVLESLQSREPASSEELARTTEPGPVRALVAPLARGRWVQLLGGPYEESAEPATAGVRTPLEERVEALEREVAEMREQLESFRRQFE
jgi:uncharacterized protein YceH (UPF0502 family)